MIDVPDKKDDWGLHNSQHPFFPPAQDEDSVKPAAKQTAKPAAAATPAPVAKPAQPAASAPSVVTPPVAAQPADGTPAQEPSTNYSPSHPAE